MWIITFTKIDGSQIEKSFKTFKGAKAHYDSFVDNMGFWLNITMHEIKIPPLSKTKEYVKTFNQKKYVENKEKILTQMKIKVICDCCNKSVNKSHLNRHQKTKKCLENRHE